MFFLFENNFQHCRTKQCETCRHHLTTTSDQTKAKEKQRKKDNIFHKKTHKIYSQSYCKRKEKKDHILTQSPICPHINTHHIIKTLPKAQRTRGLSSAHQSNVFRSYGKFSNKS